MERKLRPYQHPENNDEDTRRAKVDIIRKHSENIQGQSYVWTGGIKYISVSWGIMQWVRIGIILMFKVIDAYRHFYKASIL